MDATDFVPIRVSTLRGELKISFDAYIRVADKFILYCRNGDSFEGQRLKRLREKKLKKMFIKSEQEDDYRAYMMESIESAYDKSSKSPIETRCEVVQGAQQAAAEEVMEKPEDPVLYDIAKMGTERYVDFILNEENALKNVLSIENADKSTAHHGVNVATLSVAMAQKLNMDKTHPMHLLALGCLLHDYDHFSSGLNIGQPISELSKDDLAIYKKHPLTSAEKLAQHQHFDKEVIDIILQHEEHIDGSGFPRGIREKEMSPLSVIASTANAYDRYVSLEGVAPKEALKKILVEKMGLYPLGHLQTLQKVLKDKGVIV